MEEWLGGRVSICGTFHGFYFTKFTPLKLQYQNLKRAQRRITGCTKSSMFESPSASIRSSSHSRAISLISGHFQVLFVSLCLGKCERTQLCGPRGRWVTRLRKLFDWGTKHYLHISVLTAKCQSKPATFKMLCVRNKQRNRICSSRYELVFFPCTWHLSCTDSRPQTLLMLHLLWRGAASWEIKNKR